MEEWDVCLSERLQPDVRARIIGCNVQIERIDFLLTLHLGENLYSHTDNLSQYGSSGARFSKVPIINGPGKLLPFTLKTGLSVVLHLT